VTGTRPTKKRPGSPSQRQADPWWSNLAISKLKKVEVERVDDKAVLFRWLPGGRRRAVIERVKDKAVLFRLDWEELERKAGVKIDPTSMREFIELAIMHAGRDRFDTKSRRAFIFTVEHTWREIERTNKRGAYIQGRRQYDEIAGLSARELEYNKHNCKPAYVTRRKHDGPLIRLLTALFEAIGEKPRDATLFHDIDFLRRNGPPTLFPRHIGQERQRSRRPKLSFP
jgi:hypothetical protein